jgi:membrane-associated phospholipid phosphatase
MPPTPTLETRRPAPSGPTARPRRTARAVMVAVVAGLGLLATYVVAVRTTLGQTVDTDAMWSAVELLDRPAWTEDVLHLVGPGTVLVALVALVGMALLARGPDAAWAAVLTVIVTVGAAALLKSALDRPALTEVAANSLPSGHVAAVAGLAVAAYVLAARALRPIVALLGVAAVAATGVATVALGWHRPSDVVASAFLAIAVGAVVHAALPAGAVSPPPRR